VGASVAGLTSCLFIAPLDSRNLNNLSYTAPTALNSSALIAPRSLATLTKFSNKTKYEYSEVPHQIYTRFRLAESQGKYFTTDIAKKYKYKKL
jgi:hypothetical protein